MKKIAFLTLIASLFLFGACNKDEDTANNNNMNLNNNNTNNNNNNNNTNNNNNNTNNNNNNNGNNNNNNSSTDNFLGCFNGTTECGGTDTGEAEVKDSTSSIILVDLGYSATVNFDPDFYGIVNNDTQFTIPQQPLRQSGTGAQVHGQGILRNDSLIMYTFLNSSSLNDFECNYFLGPTSCQ